MRFTYKRVHDYLNKKLELKRKRDFFENTFTQITLDAKGFDLVYIDEFNVGIVTCMLLV